MIFFLNIFSEYGFSLCLLSIFNLKFFMKSGLLSSILRNTQVGEHYIEELLVYKKNVPQNNFFGGKYANLKNCGYSVNYFFKSKLAFRILASLLLTNY